MLSRIARIVAVSLPMLLAGVLVSAAYWRTHSHAVAAAGQVVPVPTPAPDQTAGQLEQTTLLHHLSLSVPWPALAGLVVLCVLPAVASMVAWSGARRSRETRFSTFSG